MVIVEENLTVISDFEFYGYFKYNFKMVVNSMKLVPAKNKNKQKKRFTVCYLRAETLQNY